MVTKEVSGEIHNNTSELWNISTNMILILSNKQIPFWYTYKEKMYIFKGKYKQK